MKKIAVPLAAMAASAASLFIGFTLLRSAVAGFVLYYLLCCFGLPAADILAARRLSPRRLPAMLGLIKPGRGNLALGLASGLVMAAIAVAVLAIFRERVFGDGHIREVLGAWGASGGNEGLVYAVMLAFNGAVEELFWRGYLHERLKSLPNRFLALALPTAFFAAQHIFVVSRLVADPALVALILVGILGAGAIWAYMRERTLGVLPCVVSHMLVTAGYMGALFFFSPN